MRKREIEVSVTVVDEPIDLDGWVNGYVKTVMELEGIPAISIEDERRPSRTETPLAS